MENQNINLDDLARDAGEENFMGAPKYEVPSLKLDGKRGQFVLSRKSAESGEYFDEDLGGEIKGTMLKVRRTFFAFSKNESFFTNEHNSPKDIVNLFRYYSTPSGKAKEFIMSGTAGEIKEQYQNLRMKQVIYFLLKSTSEVVKLTVKGKGLSNLFPYWKEFQDNKQHIFQFETVIRSQEEDGQLGSYYAMTFEKSSPITDLETVGAKIKEVASNIAKIDAYFAEKKTMQEDIDEAPHTRPHSDLPTVDENDLMGTGEDEIGEDEPVAEKKFNFPPEKQQEQINVADIPF